MSNYILPHELRQARVNLWEKMHSQYIRVKVKQLDLRVVLMGLEQAEQERDILARRLMEDNTSLEYGFEFPEGFTPEFTPETDTHAVRAWIDWAAREACSTGENV